MPNFSDNDFRKPSLCWIILTEFCVEVAIKDDVVAVRNSAKSDEVIYLSVAEWRPFIAGVKNNEYDA